MTEVVVTVSTGSPVSVAVDNAFDVAVVGSPSVVAHTHPATDINDSTTAGRALMTAASGTAAALVVGEVANLATLLADATFTYASGSAGSVSAGNVIITRAEGFSYIVADSGSTDNHIATAGGVKLYVQPGQTGYSVTAFGAIGDGVTDDTAAINKAITQVNTDGGGTIWFDGVYRLTENTGSSTATRFTITSDNVTLIFSERTKFLIKSDSGITQVFTLIGVSNFRSIGTLRVVSDATTPFSSFGSYGAKALSIQNVVGVDSTNINIDKVHLTRGSGGVFIVNQSGSTTRTTGVTINEIVTIDGTYGFNCQNNGDNVQIGMLRTVGAYRSYFCYGVTKHLVNMRVESPYSSATPINISRYSAAEGGSAVNTSDITIDMMVADGAAASVLATLRHLGDGGSSQSINNIVLRITSDTTPSKVLDFANYTGSGGSITATSFAALIENIFIEYSGPTATTPVATNGCAWNVAPNVVWLGATGLTLLQQRNLSPTLNFRMVKSGDQYLTDDLTFANAKYVYSYSTGGTQYRLVGVDASDNVLFSAPSTATSYTVLYGGSGGTYVNANGTTVLQVTSSAIRPNVDNTYSVGTGALRWSTIYAATGTINTSDRNEKQQIEALSDAEKAVGAELRGLVRKFKFNDSVAEKGTNARIHVGVIAQDVEALFIAHGLDPSRYGLFCRDTWEAENEVLDADGNVLQPAKQAGTRLGIRYEELFAFIIAAL